MGRVTCMGLTTLDVVQVVDRLPGPDEKMVASDGWVAFGGPAANAAATSAALGVPTRLVTALGTGPVADLARAGLEAAGVEVVDLAPTVQDLLPVSSVLVSGRSRAVVSRNAAGAPDLAEAAALIDPVLVDPGARGDVLLVDGHHLGAAMVLAHRARTAGAHVLLDGGSWKPSFEQLLAHVDTAVLSGDLVLPGHLRSGDMVLGDSVSGDMVSGGLVPGGLLPGDSVPGDSVPGDMVPRGPVSGDSVPGDMVPRGPVPGDSVPGDSVSGGPVPDGTRPGSRAEVDALLVAVAELGPRVVARSSGPGPVRVLLGPGVIEELSPERVPADQVVDTLGAGDVLHGAMAAALAGGAGPLEALAWGMRCATKSVRHRGALTWLA